MKKIKFKEYIKSYGMEKAAKRFGVSLSTIRAWRYGCRQPSVSRAKKIIIASNYQLDFESIYGAIEDV